MIILRKTSQRFGIRVLDIATVVLLLLAERAVCAEPPALTLESLCQGDPAALPAYTLRVTLEEPVQTVFRRQGTARYACVLTRGAPGFAAWCKAEQLPKPIYQPPGSPGYMEPEYDRDGNLALGMRFKWVTLSTPTINETYHEARTFFVNPEGILLKKGGVSGTLSRYAPDDLSGWALSKLRRVWWALGQGLSSCFVRIESITDGEGLRRMQIHGRVTRRPESRGVWEVAVETRPAPLLREATYIPDGWSQTFAFVQVSTKGARQFGSFTLAEEGIVRFPHPHNPFETRIVLRDFEPRFHEGLFKQVQETLERVRADETVKVLDYPWGPPTPLPVANHPPDSETAGVPKEK